MPNVWQGQGQLPVLQQDLIGNAQNYYPQRLFGQITGRALGNVQNTPQDLWDGPTAQYVFPTVGQQMRVVSSSANDAAAGTGAQTVYIHYLDGNYKEQLEIVTLNGVTPVLTVATNILRINGMHVGRVGSGGVSAGNISLTNTGNTITYGFITAGYNTAHQAIFTIPAGYTGYASHFQASSGSTGTHFCQINFRATCHAGVLLPGVFLSQDTISGQNTGYAVNYPTPIVIPAMTDIKVSAVADAVNANVTAVAALMGWYEPTPAV